MPMASLAMEGPRNPKSVENMMKLRGSEWKTMEAL